MSDILLHVQKYAEVMDPHSKQQAKQMLERRIKELEPVLEQLRAVDVDGDMLEYITTFEEDIQELKDAITSLKLN